ncbi:hypothetical protein FIE12Z_5252 [Fusarium flagelliforme]|uniref:Uncharacterized protein n=1 Tax=Fusarium flagelliforme TaxID=2675880 RepID=A0A395MTI9_9HYPO|nr:hypothetical protein FIE12Z_5252 [Fusarium flagelliforme]
MSSQQKRSREAEKPDKPNKKQNKGPATSNPENSTALDEELPSQDRDQTLSQGPDNSRAAPNDSPFHGKMPSNVTSSGVVHSPSGQPSPDEQVSARLDLTEQLQHSVRSDVQALQLLIASSVVNQSVISELIQRVEALEREAKSPSKEAILAGENEQLRRNIAILETQTENHAEELRLLRERTFLSHRQLEEQISSLESESSDKDN